MIPKAWEAGQDIGLAIVRKGRYVVDGAEKIAVYKRLTGDEQEKMCKEWVAEDPEHHLAVATWWFGSGFVVEKYDATGFATVRTKNVSGQRWLVKSDKFFAHEIEDV